MTGADDDGRADAITPAPPETPDPPRWLRNVILFLSGQTVSLFGSMLVQYAVFWYLTITYQSGLVMTLAALFGFLPQAVVSIFGGVWADRHNRKYLIMGADAAIAASTLVLAIVMIAGYDEVWLLFAVMATGVAKLTCCQPLAVSLVKVALASNVPVEVHRLPRCVPVFCELL